MKYYIVKDNKQALIFNYFQLQKYLKYHVNDKINPIILDINKKENNKVNNTTSVKYSIIF